MKPLREITGQYLELLDLASDPGSELPEDVIRDTLAGIGGELEAKALKVAEIINSMGSDVEIIDTEIKRLQDRKKIIQNREKAIKDYLRENMELCEIPKISCPLFTITLAKGRDVVVVDDESAIPEEYMRVKTIIEPDKVAIATDLKAGAEIPGAHLGKGQSSLRIK